jgi:hypothetical protein
MDFCPAKSKTLFSPRQNPWFLSTSSAYGGQSSRQSFVHMTSEPAMIGYMHKMFLGFVGITQRRQTDVFGYAQLFCSRDVAGPESGLV